jgi:hypothetical protein
VFLAWELFHSSRSDRQRGVIIIIIFSFSFFFSIFSRSLFALFTSELASKKIWTVWHYSQQRRIVEQEDDRMRALVSVSYGVSNGSRFFADDDGRPDRRLLRFFLLETIGDNRSFWTTRFSPLF